MRLDEITRRKFIGSLAAVSIAGAGNARPNNLDPFDKETQAFVFNWVARERGTKINPSKPIPEVKNFNSIDKSVFSETWGSIPDRPANTYHYKRNWVILSPVAGADSLAHEYEHYFQFAYDSGEDITNTGWDWDGVSPDTPEINASNIQRKFREFVKFQNQ